MEPSSENRSRPPIAPNLVLAIVICLGIIGIAAALKSVQKQNSASSGSVSVEPVSAPAQADSSFYATTSAASIAPVGAPDQAPAAPTAVGSTPVVHATPTIPSNGVTANAYLVADVETGQVYMEQDPDAVLPIASISKLVTALTATDILTPTTTVTVTADEAALPPDPSDLQAGERFTEQEILYPMLLDSSNVAAEALASTADRASFLEDMSSYAWEIGMSTAYFQDASGLSEHNQATANDLLALAEYLYRSRPDILAITRTVATSTATTTDHGAHVFASIHPFVKDPRFLGGKTGHTDAAMDAMLTIMDMGGHPIVFIVLHSQDRTADTNRLIAKYNAQYQ